ncbi:MAG: glycosyltransferase family 2 protein, partial [Pseudonocardiaceae bacterium]
MDPNQSLITFPAAEGERTAMPTPTVSICVPTYEPVPRQLLALLESIAAQAYPGLEVVVCDDASRRSETATILAAAPAELTVRFFRNDYNLGMVGNWNQAIRHARGALIMLVDQDDELAPGMIARYEREFADPGVMLCSGGEVFIGDHGEPARRREPVNRRHRIYRHRQRYVLDQGDVIRLSLRNGQGFGEPSGVMFRWEAWEAVGGYRKTFEHAADIDFNIRLAGLGKAVYLATPFLRRRIHAGNLTRTHVALGASSRDRLRLHMEYG